MNPISSIQAPPVSTGQLPGRLGAAEESTAFKSVLFDSIQEVNAMQDEAGRAVENLVIGGDDTRAEVLTAVQKADVAFRMMVEVRNKMVQAYEEIKSIRV